MQAPKRIYLLLTLFLTCFAFYANTLSNDYCLDDTMVITENATTQSGFAGIVDHFFQDQLYGFKHTKSKTAASSGWRPLSMMTFAMENGLFGKNKPAVSHFLNILFYALCVILFFTLLEKYLLKDTWLAFLAAMLFAIHPIHTEVVANIKSRDALLSMIFVFLSVIQLWKFLSDKKSIRLLWCFLFYFLSLTSKEDSAAFILGVPVMLYFFSNLKTKDIIRYSSVFLGGIIFYVIVRNAIVPLGKFQSNPEVINNAFLLATGTQAIGTKIYALLLDLKLLILPHPLCFDYSYNQIPYRSIGDPMVIASLLIYATLLFIALRGLKSKNIFSFSILLFLFTLSIGSNLIVDIGLILAERVLFFPSLFFCLALAALIFKAGDIISSNGKLGKPTFALIILAPLTIIAGAKTISRNADWKDDTTLALADITKSPNSARTTSAAGAAYLRMALDPKISKVEKDSLLRTTLEYMNRSLELYSENNEVLLNSGIAYSELGDYSKASECWAKVRAKNPNNSKLRGIDNIMANRYLNAGLNAINTNKIDSAIYFYNKGLEFAQQNDSARLAIYYNLGGAYFMKPDYFHAHEALGNVLAIDSNYQNARVGYAESGRLMRK